MKITGQNVNRTVGGPDTSKSDKVGHKGAGDIAKAKTGAAASLDSSAKVNLSERAQAMQKAKDIAGDQSVDEAKVARLQKMIDAGEYKVDAGAVADRMVDTHLLFPE
jgi:negative regulator of flagellin synthesis FlgM